MVTRLAEPVHRRKVNEGAIEEDIVEDFKSAGEEEGHADGGGMGEEESGEDSSA